MKEYIIQFFKDHPKLFFGIIIITLLCIIFSSCTRYSYTYVKGSEVEYEQVDSLNIKRIK